MNEENIKIYFVSFLIAFVISALLTPLVKIFAQKIHAWDLPDERKIHKRPVVRLGGVGIFFSFFITLYFLIKFNNNFKILVENNAAFIKSFFVGSIIIFALGVCDDLWGLNAFKKFPFQIIAAVIVAYFGQRVLIINNPMSGDYTLGGLSLPITVLWIVGITNAINLIDGVDGLAGGLSFIASICIFVISLKLEIFHVPYMTIILAGAILGFLLYNFYPAKIFLGDSGALFLGFCLAILSMIGTQKRSTAVIILGPLLALMVPLLDTFLALARRYFKDIKGKTIFQIIMSSPKLTIFSADQDHIHHRLLRLGFSQKITVLILYTMSIITGICAYGFTTFNNPKELILYILLIIFYIIFVGFVLFFKRRRNRAINKNNLVLK